MGPSLEAIQHTYYKTQREASSQEKMRDAADQQKEEVFRVFMSENVSK